jgi:hypothetical protein
MLLIFVQIYLNHILLLFDLIYEQILYVIICV